jgi:hypothetical protein
VRDTLALQEIIGSNPDIPQGFRDNIAMLLYKLGSANILVCFILKKIGTILKI